MEVINTLGRRKTAVARIYLTKGKGNVTVNKKDYTEAFPTSVLQSKILQPFALTDTVGKYDVKVNVSGFIDRLDMDSTSEISVMCLSIVSFEAQIPNTDINLRHVVEPLVNLCNNSETSNGTRQTHLLFAVNNSEKEVKSLW